jgi:hypothetical protein
LDLEELLREELDQPLMETEEMEGTPPRSEKPLSVVVAEETTLTAKADEEVQMEALRTGRKRLEAMFLLTDLRGTEAVTA